MSPEGIHHVWFVVNATSLHRILRPQCFTIFAGKLIQELVELRNHLPVHSDDLNMTLVSMCFHSAHHDDSVGLPFGKDHEAPG